MLTHRFTRRGVELKLAPDTGAPAGGAAPAPAAGKSQPVNIKSSVTVAQREARAADERDLSPENESIVPGLGDITRHLNTSGVTFANAGEQQQADDTAADIEPEPAPETTTTDISLSPEIEDTSEEEVESEQDQETEEAPERETTDEEPEAEAETEEAIEEIIEVDGKRYKLPEAVQESINARIGKLTAKRKELESQLATEKQEKEALTAQAAQNSGEPLRIAPTPENPLASVVTPTELDSKVREAEQAKLWAIENPEGAEVVINRETGETKFIEPERVRTILANAERTLSAAPRRREYLQAKTQADGILAKAYPDVAKTGTPANAALQQIRRGMPWLVAQFPDADLIIADAMLGKRIRETSADQRKPLKPVPRSAAAPQPKPAPRVPARQMEARQGKRSFVENRGDARSTLQVAESLVGLS